MFYLLDAAIALLIPRTTKLLSSRKEDQLIGLEQSLIMYRYIVSYYDEHGCSAFEVGRGP